MVDDDDSISECLIVNLLVLISSVNGARKATFLDVGNIGRDWEKEAVRQRSRETGPLVKTDVAANVSL